MGCWQLKQFLEEVQLSDAGSESLGVRNQQQGVVAEAVKKVDGPELGSRTLDLALWVECFWTGCGPEAYVQVFPIPAVWHQLSADISAGSIHSRDKISADAIRVSVT